MIIIESLTMLAFIPGLCPFDDIIIWLFFPAIGLWLLKKFKWCRKSCKCGCHSQNKDLCKDCGQDYKDHVKGYFGGIDCPQPRPVKISFWDRCNSWILTHFEFKAKQPKMKRNWFKFP